MKRPMTLIGGILGTVVNAILAVVMLIGSVLALEIVGAVGAQAGYATITVIFIISIVMFVIALVMSIISITAWAKDVDDYKKKKGILITSIIFNFISAIFAILTGTALGIVLGIIVIAAAVLLIVDIALEVHRIPTETIEPTED